ncbi:class I SAM-dependent methyltransferase [Myxococcota bacterium]|nr:class I SAM-dependent methyltransferase [Myxococcota bacterium]
MSVRLECMTSCLDRIGIAHGARILDAGCGPGHLLAAMALRGWVCFGLDTSRAMLELSRKRIGITPPKLAAGSVEMLPFQSESFDVVCTAGVFEYLPSDRKGLEEFARVIRPGGYLLFPITNFWSPAGYLDFAVEGIKRQRLLLRAINKVWTRSGQAPIRARNFRVRRQRPGQTRDLLRTVGFEVLEERYFYFLPFPHPFDRMFPGVTETLSRAMESLADTPLAGIGEGWLAVCRKRE